MAGNGFFSTLLLAFERVYECVFKCVILAHSPASIMEKKKKRIIKNTKHSICITSDDVSLVIRCEAWEIDEYAPKVDRRKVVEAVRYVAPAGMAVEGWDAPSSHQGFNKQPHSRAGINIELTRVAYGGIEPATHRFKSQGEAAAFLGTSNAQVSLRKRSGKPMYNVNDGFNYTIRQV